MQINLIRFLSFGGTSINFPCFCCDVFVGPSLSQSSCCAAFIGSAHHDDSRRFRRFFPRRLCFFLCGSAILGVEVFLCMFFSGELLQNCLSATFEWC